MQEHVLTLIFARSRMESILLLRMLKLVIRHFITCSVPKRTQYYVPSEAVMDGQYVHTYILENLISDGTIIYVAVLDRNYSIAYFQHITEFDAL